MQSVFYSFDYDEDNWRVQKVQNMGQVEGGPAFTPQDWEKVKRSSDAAIENWIDAQMKYTRAVIVLIGSLTSESRWVRYEIVKAWGERRPLVGIDIHGLEDSRGRTSYRGENPFNIPLRDGTNMSHYVERHQPSGVNSQMVYNSIRSNIEDWVSRAYRR
ncbi:TIR domain-containing protein [Ornithinimicrobium sp. Y1847]|uniref:TIR domain-containing protein n=1 Tax=Ornithinimicrobium sp. Y1847 TaxID=3405419 RepID=UPI003B6762A1